MCSFLLYSDLGEHPCTGAIAVADDIPQIFLNAVTAVAFVFTINQ